MKYLALIAVSLLLAVHAADSQQPEVSVPAQRDWPAYGGGPDDTRYSPLKQINVENVRNLQVAWRYDTGEKGGMETALLS